MTSLKTIFEGSNVSNYLPRKMAVLTKCACNLAYYVNKAAHIKRFLSVFTFKNTKVSS